LLTICSQLPTEARGSGATPDGSDYAVRLERVSKRYESVTAVEDVSLDVAPGEFVSILGPSGSGKTTTMRIIGGFVQPDGGRVEILGREVTHLPPHRRDVNTVFQSYGLFPHMTVEQNVGYGLRIRRVPRTERGRRVAEVLERVRLEHVSKSRPHQLSGGMQQRVALARAIVNKPAVLLLDEPLGALDRSLREHMQVELRQLQTALGITFIYVTHDQDEALGMSDRLVVMRNGRIVQVGPPASIYDEPANIWVARFVGGSNELTGTVTDHGDGLAVHTDVAEIAAAHIHGRHELGSRAFAMIRPENVEIRASSSDAGRSTVRVTVHEILNVGDRIKVVAATPGGIELIAQRQRDTGSAWDVRPGSEVDFVLPREAVHIYPIEDHRSEEVNTATSRVESQLVSSLPTS
jgi:spermidine/putrescine ABC transporter ATP-binding subunit